MSGWGTPRFWTEDTLGRGRRRGGALIAVLILMPLILLSLAAYWGRATTEYQGVRRHVWTTRATYIAQAGNHRALRALSDDPTWRAGYTNVQFDGGLYTVTVLDSVTIPSLDDNLIIRSLGMARDGTEGVDRTVEVLVAPGEMKSRLDYAISGSDIHLNGGAQIGTPVNKNSEVYVRYTLDGSGGTYLYGKGETVQSSSAPGGLVVDPGPIATNAPSLPNPTFDLSILRQTAIDNGTFYTGDQVFKDVTLNGVIFVENGSVDFRGAVTLNGCIVSGGAFPEIINVSGTLTIRPDMVLAPNLALLNPTRYLKIKSAASIDIEGLLFVGNSEMDGSGTIRGSVISTSVQNLGGSSVIVFEKMATDDLPPGVTMPGIPTGIQILVWTES